MKEKDLTCPRTRFKNYLLAQLRKCREQGDRLIVCMDVNKDIYRKSIGKALTMSEDLQMIEPAGITHAPIITTSEVTQTPPIGFVPLKNVAPIFFPV